MSEQKNKYGEPVCLAILTKEIYMELFPIKDDSEEYERQVEEHIEQYPFYNVLHKNGVSSYSREYAEAMGWEIPQTDFTHGGSGNE